MLQVLYIPLKVILLLIECGILSLERLNLRLKAIGYLTREVLIFHLGRVESVI